MAQFYFSLKQPDGTTLCLAPLTDRLLAFCCEEVPDPSGYFLFERRERGAIEDVEIIARVDTDDAAVKLSAMLGLT